MHGAAGNSDTTAGICAVIVTYHPPPSVIHNVDCLRPQVAELVIVDNGSDEQSSVLLSQLEKIPGVRVFRNAKNLGIAAALNIGIRYAADANYPWIATFDQDSTVTPDFSESMLAAYAAYPSKEKVALVSPIHCVSEAEWKQKSHEDLGRTCSLIRVAMTSGSLIKTRVLMDAGLYDEAMFIDYVDFDLCLRLCQRGHKLMLSCHSFLLHRLGSLEKHSFLGFPLTIKSHNATRRYYIMRNRIIMYRRYAVSFPFWAMKDFAWLLLELAKILVFEQDKGNKLSHALKGIRHGLAGISGPLAQTQV